MAKFAKSFCKWYFFLLACSYIITRRSSSLRNTGNTQNQCPPNIEPADFLRPGSDSMIQKPRFCTTLQQSVTSLSLINISWEYELQDRPAHPEPTLMMQSDVCSQGKVTPCRICIPYYGDPNCTNNRGHDHYSCSLITDPESVFFELLLFSDSATTITFNLSVTILFGNTRFAPFSNPINVNVTVTVMDDVSTTNYNTTYDCSDSETSVPSEKNTESPATPHGSTYSHTVDTHTTNDMPSSNDTSETSESSTVLSESVTSDGNTIASSRQIGIYVYAGVGGAVGLIGVIIALVITILLFILAKTRRKSNSKKLKKARNVELSHVDGYERATDSTQINTNSEGDLQPAKIELSNACTTTETSTDTKQSLQDHDYSTSEDINSKTTVKNTLYEKVVEPTVAAFDRDVCVVEGQQVTLRVSFSGTPTPKLSWTFNGSKVDGDYAIELGMDGSLLFVCVERKHAGRYHFVVSNTLGSVEGDVNLIVQNEDESREDVSQINSLDSHPVSEDEFGEHVATSHSNNNNMFILQYQSLASGEEGKLVDVGKSELNRPLNRFRNITAYDDQRIILGAAVAGSSSSDSQTATDYINASYINGYSQVKQYIASQGPLPNTMTDFWQMVWQEKVKIIAMVTNTMEGWSKKCEQYWPDCGRGQSHGPFNISLVEEVVFADYTVRKIQLTHTDKGENSCKVMQYHFTSWPDHGVPEYAGPILNYLRRIKAQHKPNKGPILVHCSAGVGRTGTLIAIDTALAQASKERQVDIPKIIVDMRKQRMKMVQTADQYAFIHDAVLESLMCGDTQIQSCNLRRGLGKLEETDKHNNMTGFEKHFKVLEQVSPKPSEVYSESATKYQEKNRTKSFLPPEKWRVTLKKETPDYIHASFANGYKQKKGFIIAQSPMDSTARDFVKMLYQRECGVVVMLCGCEEGGVEVCTQYWPTSVGTTMKYGELLVSNTSATNSDGVTKRIISISDPKSDRVQKVTQFQVDQWREEGTCSNSQALMDVIDQMGVVQRRTGNKSIVVHGIDTVSRVGVFCSVVNAIEMCKTEGVVDVFQVVKALRIQKPGAVQTVNQYQSIFNLVVLFLDSFSVYSNFK